ncbi:energy-coupling factor transporter transmembrane protein EcfT [Lactiplantibacillus garii]|uniref:Energy-coupling factor transporter transmembrane protein EcfT n=1 Tax=Lactiplantibacillus garii TaxID=2306423 RepID=A0A3R8L218_9LACO|nr:energy-coupling factor transporter transmembrane component T [Lactiplantibacillus garii]RRK10942.1 energy-coupling factor transporter transmembrane protein EcfT [Lactiplantibacillus garii]
MDPKQPTELPDWLQQPASAHSQASKTSFLQRNQRHLRSLLTRLAQPAPVVKNQRWHLAPQINLIRLLLLVLLIALINNVTLLWCLALLLGFQLLLLPPSQLRRFVRSWLISSFVALLFVLPSYWLTGPGTLLFFGLKTSLMLANAQYYRLTTPFQDLLSGLKALHCPDVLIMTLAIAITYLRMLGQHLLLTMEALELRTVAPTKHPYRLIGAMFGNLYLKSYAYALELYAAMEARGFNGHYVRTSPTRNHWPDYLSLGPDILVLILFIFWRN